MVLVFVLLERKEYIIPTLELLVQMPLRILVYGHKILQYQYHRLLLLLYRQEPLLLICLDVSKYIRRTQRIHRIKIRCWSMTTLKEIQSCVIQVCHTMNHLTMMLEVYHGRLFMVNQRNKKVVLIQETQEILLHQRHQNHPPQTNQWVIQNAQAHCPQG